MQHSLRRALREELRWSALGRKGDLGSSSYSDDFEFYGFEMIGEAAEKIKDEGHDDGEWVKVAFGKEEENPSNSNGSKTTHGEESKMLTNKQHEEKLVGGNEKTQADTRGKEQEGQFDHVELAGGKEYTGKASQEIEAKTSNKSDEDENLKRVEITVQNVERRRDIRINDCTSTQRSDIQTQNSIQEHSSKLYNRSVDLQHMHHGSKE
ncbi:hypothetical protein Nepgr_005171 [Nepenthes gracilis]|uniref:Uncharacterized protein n=1 Tax=Nepenthes gracilis TaxID=150966 RepID=A0AAD3S2Z5_NEPGR|nr:hypothetical protein Nepgr_005171 [Nepenthes gracilis]